MPAFSLPHLHQQSPTGFPQCGTLPYHPQPLPPPNTWEDERNTLQVRGFGGVLEPRYIVGARSLDQ